MNNTWKEAILAIVQNRKDKEVSLGEIYEEIKTQSFVTRYHYQPWTEDGQPRYQCWTRRYLTDLVDEGKIIRVGRGLYRRV